MAIPPSLKASARAAYRSLFRAASVTFSGDGHVLNAFKEKTRLAYREGRSLTDTKRYEDNIRLARDVADVLRTNIVQARKTSATDIWELNITKETELGDNDTIKNPPKHSSPREPSQKRGLPLTAQPQTPHIQRINFSELKRLRKQREVPRLDENDLEESFVRGSGPGGQSVNKTENCVQIVHKPTGLRVSCQETRSLDLNRRTARKLLIEKLDRVQNPGLSHGEMRRARMNERERQKRKKRRKKESQLEQSASNEEQVD
ncbi:hypothetical protein K439DRAFT_1392104 [Ramaria rubella]|nr:hypothetical protein K439DRAFT_1392104 [Ramaria rubella]